MHSTTFDSTFQTVNFDSLADVTGGAVNWGELGRATAGGAVAGGVGGAIVGAATGPGALLGAAGGAVGGGIASGVNNFGQQMGWWR